MPERRNQSESRHIVLALVFSFKAPLYELDRPDGNSPTRLNIVRLNSTAATRRTRTQAVPKQARVQSIKPIIRTPVKRSRHGKDCVSIVSKTQAFQIIAEMGHGDERGDSFGQSAMRHSTTGIGPRRVRTRSTDGKQESEKELDAHDEMKALWQGRMLLPLQRMSQEKDQRQKMRDPKLIK